MFNSYKMDELLQELARLFGSKTADRVRSLRQAQESGRKTKLPPTKKAPEGIRRAIKDMNDVKIEEKRIHQQLTDIDRQMTDLEVGGQAETAMYTKLLRTRGNLRRQMRQVENTKGAIQQRLENQIRADEQRAERIQPQKPATDEELRKKIVKEVEQEEEKEVEKEMSKPKPTAPPSTPISKPKPAPKPVIKPSKPAPKPVSKPSKPAPKQVSKPVQPTQSPQPIHPHQSSITKTDVSSLLSNLKMEGDADKIDHQYASEISEIDDQKFYNELIPTLEEQYNRIISDIFENNDTLYDPHMTTKNSFYRDKLRSDKFNRTNLMKADMYIPPRVNHFKGVDIGPEDVFMPKFSMTTSISMTAPMIGIGN
jgi:hypothetical protein